jgi:hypothetical protein
MMADEAIDAEDEDFSHGKWISPQADTSYRGSRAFYPGCAWQTN